MVTYEGHDGFCDVTAFDRWVISARGTELIFEDVRYNLDTIRIYRFSDAIIKYEGSGDHKDGAPVEINVECRTGKTLDQICSSLVKRFPRLVCVD